MVRETKGSSVQGCSGFSLEPRPLPLHEKRIARPRAFARNMPHRFSRNSNTPSDICVSRTSKPPAFHATHFSVPSALYLFAVDPRPATPCDAPPFPSKTIIYHLPPYPSNVQLWIPYFFFDFKRKLLTYHNTAPSDGKAIAHPVCSCKHGKRNVKAPLFGRIQMSRYPDSTKCGKAISLMFPQNLP